MRNAIQGERFLLGNNESLMKNSSKLHSSLKKLYNVVINHHLRVAIADKVTDFFKLIVRLIQLMC
jgi:hypothetical protein